MVEANETNEMQVMQKEEKSMRILYKVPGYESIVTTCPDDLHEEQALVKGLIEPIYLGDSDESGNSVIVVCNEEGKLIGMPPCVDLVKDGKTVEIINGPIFVCCSDDEGSFVSLSDKQIKKYQDMLDRNVIEI